MDYYLPHLCVIFFTINRLISVMIFGLIYLVQTIDGLTQK